MEVSLPYDRSMKHIIYLIAACFQLKALTALPQNRVTVREWNGRVDANDGWDVSPEDVPVFKPSF